MERGLTPVSPRQYTAPLTRLCGAATELPCPKCENPTEIRGKSLNNANNDISHEFSIIFKNNFLKIFCHTFEYQVIGIRVFNKVLIKI